MWRMRLAFCAGLIAVASPAQESREGPANGASSIRVGVLNDNFPFSFEAATGEPTGFVVDLFAAIEEVMGFSAERVVGNTRSINSAFRAGQLELLQSYARSRDREGHAEFSVPYLIMDGAVFVRRGLPTIATLEQLRGRRVLVHRGSFGEQLLLAAGLGDSIVLVDSVEQAFRQVDSGAGDATLASRLTGMSTIQRFELDSVRVTDVEVPGYSVRYCFAVQKDDAELLARINEGLAILHQTGRFEQIYHRWFRHLEPHGFTAFDVALAVAVGLALALIVALWALFRHRALHRRIAVQSQALQANEERLRSLFDATPVGLLVLAPADGDADGYHLLETNPAAQRLFGWAQSPASGTRMFAAAPQQTPLWRRVVQALEASAPRSFEQQLEPVEGGNRWVRGVVAPLGAHCLLVLADITEEKVAAQRMQVHEQRVRQAQKLEALGTLSSGIAHDFNNILAAIIGNTELAIMDLPEAGPHRLLNNVLQAADRARALVRQILTFSRHTPPRREALSIAALIEETLGLLRAAAPASIELRHERQQTAPLIEADPAQVHQVLMNLCTNALQAMGDKPGTLTVTETVVHVTTELGEAIDRLNGLPAGNYVRITVSDTGIGMPAEVLARMYEPYFTTKPAGEGTGLGLSVVHGIMQSHRGAVTAESTPGVGTDMHLYFPVTAASAGDPARKSSAPFELAGARVLMVDDETSVLEVASELLRRQGCAVTSFADPTTAVRAFVQRPGAFDLVITDLTMPGINGFEVAAHVRLCRPDIPMIVMSGHLTEEHRRIARDLHVQCLLDKPASGPALIRAVGENLPLRHA